MPSDSPASSDRTFRAVQLQKNEAEILAKDRPCGTCGCLLTFHEEGWRDHYHKKHGRAHGLKEKWYRCDACYRCFGVSDVPDDIDIRRASERRSARIVGLVVLWNMVTVL